MIRKLVNFVFPLCLNNTKIIVTVNQNHCQTGLNQTFIVIKGSPSSIRLAFTKSTCSRHVINKCHDIQSIIVINYMGEGKYPSTLEFLKHTKKSKMEFRLAVFEIRCSFLSSRLIFDQIN